MEDTYKTLRLDLWHICDKLVELVTSDPSNNFDDELYITTNLLIGLYGRFEKMEEEHVQDLLEI